MHHHYEDIRSRIAGDPKWFDENAVPRYCEFAPNEVSDIYADEVALVGITCQGCEHRFKVAFSSSSISRLMARRDNEAKVLTLAELIRTKAIHYGDPPNIDCCAAGPTMNSEPRKVLEFWARKSFEWVRHPDLEIDVTPDWVENEAS